MAMHVQHAQAWDIIPDTYKNRAGRPAAPPTCIVLDDPLPMPNQREQQYSVVAHVWQGTAILP